MRGVKREIDWAQYDALIAQYNSRRQVAGAMGLTESTLRDAEKRRGAAPAVAAEVLPALSADERQALVQAEQTIAAGLETFYAVGVAFLEIRDRRLYREDFPTFEAYCQERWGMGRSHAYRAMDYAGVVTHLREASPIGDILPANEAQARPLAALPPGEQVEAWREAVETAPPNGVTAAHVTQTVKARAQRTSPVKPAREASPIGDIGPSQAPPPAARRPARLAVQKRLVALLEYIPDAQAWAILETLAVELQSGELRDRLPDELSTRLHDEIETLWEHFSVPKRPRSSRAQRWHDAVETLQGLKDEYEAWLENMPESLQMSNTAELLQEIVNLDLSDLDVEHPRGFGRD